MKKVLLLSCFALAGFSQAFSQLTLTQTDFPAPAASTDSVNITYGSQNLPSSIGAYGNGLTYDLTGITYSVYDTPYTFHLAPPAPYSYEDFVYNRVSGPLQFHGYVFYTINAAGYKQNGEEIYYQGYSLSTVPGAQSTDSLVFPTQTTYYSSPLTKVKFPATYGSFWNSDYTSDVNFILSYNTLYHNAPGLYRTLISERDTVIGSGNMIVKDQNGNNSTPIPVLVDKIYNRRVDSFYLNDSAAPPALLFAFGLTQGNITNTYTYRFYRSGDVTPLADITYNDSTFGDSAINNIIVHSQNTPLTVGNVAQNNVISIYPNPVTSHTLSISWLSQDNSEQRYELINVLGQEVATAALPANVVNAKISLPNSVTPGTYYIRLYSNGKQIAVRPVNVLN